MHAFAGGVNGAEESPVFGRDAAEGFLEAILQLAVPGDFANEGVEDLSGISAGKRAVDFRVAFAGVADEDEFSTGVVFQQVFDGTGLGFAA